MCTLFSAALAIAYIVLLRWFAKTIVWTVIVLFCLSILLTIVGVLSAGNQGNQENSGGTFAAIFLGIILAIVIILVVLNRKKINIACEVIREAAK